MKNSTSTHSQSSPNAAASPDTGFSPWGQLKTKRVAYLTLPLLVMATIVEFVILATGWKYQQVVCLPQGMGVTFFGIGPIGATILAVELLKLPLAIWTASRQGWQKGFMLIVGLPLICVLTFQLVKDMAVYEMGVAMTPASQMLEKAATEEIKIVQLNAELQNQIKDDGAVKATIEEKKADRDRKLAELNAKQTKAKAEIEESLKRNDATRQDAITLTDYQKKELSEAEVRQATIIRQFDADAAQLTKAISDLRTRRETELARATTWNAEEARIENAYKAKLADYTNRKRAYEKEKAEYDKANFIKRQLMKEPIDPGVPPERESNKILKSTLVAELEAQIKAKEAELVAINNKRRDRVAQVDVDARRLREDFDRRSGTKREETDRKREELLAAMAQVVKEGAAEAKKIDQEFDVAVQKEQDTLKSQRPLEVIRAELDACRKKADGFYEVREAAIKKTQVHRIATTVEIVRGWLFGERPVSITATAKQRGDLLTDQISMVRIWVYPVLAFIVAFLPTLMVEIGFSTVFKPEQQRPSYRLGFCGRRLHWLYTRAGRHKILRAERLAREASAQIAFRDDALTEAKATAEQALSEKEAELQAAREAVVAAAAEYEEQSKRKDEEYHAHLQKKEAEWVAKLAGTTDSLNRAIIEKDALRDLQKSEVERQIQMRQNAWSDRLTQLRQELDDQRTAAEAERTALMQEHHKKLMEVTEDCKTQVIQIRRQMADAELAAVEASAKLSHDLKEALHARDTAESQLKHQADSFSAQLSQAREDAAHEVEKAARQEKHRLERQLASQAREAEARLRQELQQKELASLAKLKQREQELVSQAATREAELQNQSAADLHTREEEWQRQTEARVRAIETRLGQETQQREEMLQIKMRQREQQLQSQVEARQAELKTHWEQELHNREQEWERNAEAAARATESRWTTEMQQKEELFQSKLRQRDQQWQAKLDTVRVELQAQKEQEQRRRELELAEARQHEEDLSAQLAEQAAAREMVEKQLKTELESARANIEPLKLLLARVEQERDEAIQSASESVRQAQDMEKKLTEASSLLTGWKNGKGSDGGRGKDAFKVAA
jgi:hypothetical protein